MSLSPAFQGEVMLAGWSETHNGGAKVTFWLQDEADLASFKAMTVAKGKTAGQRLAIVAVEIGDDEQPVVSHGEQTKPVVVQNEPNSGNNKYRVLACQLCKNEAFLNFVGAANEQEARAYILNLCDVSSRKELDTDVAASYIFEKLRKEFRALVMGQH